MLPKRSSPDSCLKLYQLTLRTQSPLKPFRLLTRRQGYKRRLHWVHVEWAIRKTYRRSCRLTKWWGINLSLFMTRKISTSLWTCIHTNRTGFSWKPSQVALSSKLRVRRCLIHWTLNSTKQENNKLLVRTRLKKLLAPLKLKPRSWALTWVFSRSNKTISTKITSKPTCHANH